MSYSGKVVGLETITVPAGTFQTYVIEATRFWPDGGVNRIKEWVDPRYGLPIRRELQSRTRYASKIYESMRTELTSVQAERS
jgi:hypothetical protein